MRKKYMRIVCLCLVLIMLASGCAAKEEGKNTMEAKLLETAKAKDRSLQTSYSYNFKEFAYERTAEGYKITIDDYTAPLALSERETLKYEVENATDATEKELKIASKALDLVIEYINGSTIIKNKEKDIEILKKVEVKVADIPEYATYYKCRIYIGEATREDICEKVLVNAYIKALRDITNSVYRFSSSEYEILNEAMSWTITEYIGGKLDRDVVLPYSSYLQHTLYFIGCFREMALEAYFYGYDVIYEQIDKQDFRCYLEMFKEANDNKPYDIAAAGCLRNFRPIVQPDYVELEPELNLFG